VGYEGEKEEAGEDEEEEPNSLPKEEEPELFSVGFIPV